MAWCHTLFTAITGVLQPALAFYDGKNYDTRNDQNCKYSEDRYDRTV